MERFRHENIPVRMALSLRQQAEELARQQGISLNHFVTLALEEKIQRMQEKQELTMPNRLQSAG